MEDLYKYLKDTATVNPNVAVSLAIADASDDTQDATAVAADIKEGKTAYIATGKVTGTFKGVDTSDATAVAGDLLNGKTAYVNGSKVVGTIVSKEAQTYTPSSSEQVINAGQYLVGAQTITAVPTEEKSATPSTAEQEVVPTAGKFLSKVTVGGDANLVADNIKSGVSIFGVQGTLTSLDTSDANATATDILTGKTAYVNGSKVTGTIPSVEAATITPGTLDQTISAGQYVAGAQTIKGEPNLLAENIKKDVAIFGVTGTYEATSTGIDTSDATATANQILQGATAYVKGAKVTGTYVPLNTSDANATAADIATGKTAYVNGQKITGTHTCAPTTVTAVYKGKVKDTSEITLQTDSQTSIMKNNFEFDDGYVLAEGDVIMFPDNAWVSAVVTNADVAICNHSSSNTYELKGKPCYVMSKAEAMA